MASWSWRSVTMPRSRRMRARMGKASPARILVYDPRAAETRPYAPGAGAESPSRRQAGGEMAFRFHRLKTRTGFAIACVVVGTLVLNAVYTVLSQRTELRREIEERARTFAELTHGPICIAYEELA